MSADEASSHITIQKASSSPGSYGEYSRSGTEQSRSESSGDSPSDSGGSSSIRSHDWFSDDSLQVEIDDNLVYKESMRLHSAGEDDEASSRSAGLDEGQLNNLTASQKDKQHILRLLTSSGPKYKGEDKEQMGKYKKREQEAVAQGLDHCMTQANEIREERRSQAAIDKPQ